MKKKNLEADEGKNGYQKAHPGSWWQTPQLRSGMDKITSYQSSETDGQEKSTKAANDALENFDRLPDSAFVRIRTVCSLVGAGPASVWRWSKSGRLPVPRKLSSGVTGWNVGQLRTFLRAG
jgi:predicted DNA-binding transcriptional regulator AlpA